MSDRRSGQRWETSSTRLEPANGESRSTIDSTDIGSTGTDNNTRSTDNHTHSRGNHTKRDLQKRNRDRAGNDLRAENDLRARSDPRARNALLGVPQSYGHQKYAHHTRRSGDR